MHYVDEGPRDGKPVVMVHGNPTWGYLYRHFIKPIADAGYRAIAVDHLGMGRSDKPSKAKLFTVPRHADRFVALMDSLDLRDATVVVQDWGGPIGLAWAARRPEHVRGLYIMNTFAHRPPEGTKVPNILRFIRAPIVGELLIKGGPRVCQAALVQSDPSRPTQRRRARRLSCAASHNRLTHTVAGIPQTNPRQPPRTSRRFSRRG